MKRQRKVQHGGNHSSSRRLIGYVARRVWRLRQAAAAPPHVLRNRDKRRNLVAPDSEPGHNRLTIPAEIVLVFLGLLLFPVGIARPATNWTGLGGANDE